MICLKEKIYRKKKKKTFLIHSDSVFPTFVCNLLDSIYNLYSECYDQICDCASYCLVQGQSGELYLTPAALSFPATV